MRQCVTWASRREPPTREGDATWAGDPNAATRKVPALRGWVSSRSERKAALLLNERGFVACHRCYPVAWSARPRRRPARNSLFLLLRHPSPLTSRAPTDRRGGGNERSPRTLSAHGQPRTLQARTRSTRFCDVAKTSRYRPTATTMVRERTKCAAGGACAAARQSKTTGQLSGPLFPTQPQRALGKAGLASPRARAARLRPRRARRRRRAGKRAFPERAQA